MILLVAVFALFAFQNANRFPMQDINGSYLSLDLYFGGIQLREALAVPWLLAIAFLLGVVSSGLYFLMLISSKGLHLSDVLHTEASSDDHYSS
jgi:hypothetical protein